MKKESRPQRVADFGRGSFVFKNNIFVTLVVDPSPALFKLMMASLHSHRSSNRTSLKLTPIPITKNHRSTPDDALHVFYFYIISIFTTHDS